MWEIGSRIMSERSKKYLEDFLKKVSRLREERQAKNKTSSKQLKQDSAPKQDAISQGNNIPDLPQILASLDIVVKLTNNLRKGTRVKLDNVLAAHIGTLQMLRQHLLEMARFMESNKAEVEVFTQLMQELFEKDGTITNYAKRLSQSCPHISEKQLDTFQKIEEQIKDLLQLRRKLLEGDEISKIANRQVEIMRDFPNIFPKGSPIRNSLEKQISLLK